MLGDKSTNKTKQKLYFIKICIVTYNCCFLHTRGLLIMGYKRSNWFISITNCCIFWLTKFSGNNCLPIWVCQTLHCNTYFPQELPRMPWNPATITPGLPTLDSWTATTMAPVTDHTSMSELNLDTMKSFDWPGENIYQWNESSGQGGIKFLPSWEMQSSVWYFARNSRSPIILKPFISVIHNKLNQQMY